MKKAYLYVRVSTEEQKRHGLSVDAQVIALTKWCEDNQYEVVDIYNDAGISAHVNYKKRKELLRLIADVNKSKNGIILFTKLDRWFRSVKDYYAVMSQIPESVTWKAIWEDYDIDTSEGRFKTNIMLSVAQTESERTAQRVKSIYQYKKEKGDYVGQVATGYKRENGKVVKDKNKQDEIEFMFRAFARTQSIRRTTEIMSEYGYEVSRSCVQRRIHNHVYCGVKDNATFEPYITEEQFRINQSYLQDKIKESAKAPDDYMFKGLCRCGYCDRNMSSHTTYNKHANGDKVPCKFYVCNGRTNLQKHNQNCQISEKNLEAYLLSNIEKIIGDYNISVDVPIKEIDYDKQIKSINERIERIGIRFELGHISIEEYKEKRDALIKEINELEIKKGSKEKIVMPTNWQEMYNQLDIIHRRMFWKTIIYKVIITNETKENPEIIFR